ncbi:hypothetical protein ACLB2K_027952 [Fragaria x ananassa]
MEDVESLPHDESRFHEFLPYQPPLVERMVQSKEPRIQPRPNPRSLPDSQSLPDSRSRPETDRERTFPIRRYIPSPNQQCSPISHPDPATALEILKRDFHSFREQAAKERAEAEVYRVRIAELEKEQFLLRATLDHRNMYNDSLDRAARVAGTPDSATSSLPNQGQGGSMFPGGPNQIIYVTHPLTNSSFPLPAPQPSAIPNEPPCQINLIHLLNLSPLLPLPTPPNLPLNMSTRLLLQLSQSVTQLASWIEGVESRGIQRPLFSGYGHRPSPFTPRVQMKQRPPKAKPPQGGQV